MKSNKNTDFVKKFKYFIIAPLVLLLVGIVLFFTIGFNKGIDFTGGTQVNVYVGPTLTQTEVREEVEDKIEKVLSNNGISISGDYRESTNDLGLCLSFRYQPLKNKTEKEMEQINSVVSQQLFDEFGYDSQDDIEKNYVQVNSNIDASVGTSLVVNVFSAVVIASLVILLYMFIRFGVTSAMSALLCVYHDVLIMLVLALICRIEINTPFTASVIAVMFLSFINTALYFDKIRETVKLDNVIQNKQIANATVKQNLPQSILFNSIILGALVLFATIAVGQVASFAVPVIFGVLASFYSSNFIAPTLWSFAYTKKAKVKKIK